jgi:hypothetical protein
MNPNCIAEVNAVAGRSLSKDELDRIENRLRDTMTRLARKDPQAWIQLPYDQRVLKATQLAMEDIKAEAARKVENVERQVLRTAETSERLKSSRERNAWNHAKALAEDYQLTAYRADGIKRDFVRHLQDLLDAARDGQGAAIAKRAFMFLFDAENPAMARDLAMEIFSRGKAGTGNKLAKEGADAWLVTIEAARSRFNKAGGDLRTLRYDYLPRSRRPSCRCWIASDTCTLMVGS